MNTRFIQITLLLMMFSAAIFAENIYKSVDENGRVTYSSTPPENSVDSITVDIPPPPSQQQIEAAQQRHEQNLKAAELLDANRKSRNEIIDQGNRQRLEKQKQFQQQTQQDEPKDNNIYPYYRPRYPGVIIPPGRPVPPAADRPDIDRPGIGRPVINRPAIDRPVQLPAR